MFEQVTGLVVVASWLNAPLFAIETFAALTYFGRFWATDTRLYRWSIILAIAVDAGTVITVCAATYLYTITNWGDAAYAITQPWFISTYIVLCGVSAMICQGLLSLRIYRLSKAWWYLPLLLAPALLSLGGACATSAMAATLDLSGRESLTKVVILWLAAKAAADIAIAAAQIWNLQQVKAQFADSRHIVRRLSWKALETGSVTAVLAIAAIACYIALPESNWAVLIGMTLGRVYSITLLTNLNGRNYDGKDEDDALAKSRTGGGRRVGFASEQPVRHAGGKSGEIGIKSAARFDAADEEDDFDAVDGTIVYRTHTSGRVKRSADLDAEGRGWQQHTPGSEVELGKAPLKHY